MKAYEFKAYVQNNQMTLPKDYGEILNNKSVRVIVLEKETFNEEPKTAPITHEIKIPHNKSGHSNHNTSHVRKRTSNPDKQLKNILDELSQF